MTEKAPAKKKAKRKEAPKKSSFEKESAELYHLERYLSTLKSAYALDGVKTIQKIRKKLQKL